MILLPEPYRKKTIFALYNATHAGAKITTQMAREHYFWKGMNKHIKAIIKTCDACQKSKSTHHERAKPGTYPLSQTRFKNIHLDLVGPVEQSSGGNKHLLTIIDRSTRFPVAVPLLNTDAQTIWKSFEASWIQLFGVPVNLITDRGSQFTGSYWAQGLQHQPQHHSCLQSSTKWTGRVLALCPQGYTQGNS